MYKNNKTRYQTAVSEQGTYGGRWRAAHIAAVPHKSALHTSLTGSCSDNVFSTGYEILTTVPSDKISVTTDGVRIGNRAY
jgi:hypothetical protein